LGDCEKPKLSPHAILSPGYPLQSFAFHDLSSIDAFAKQKDFHYYPCRRFPQSIKISQKKDHPTINDKLSLRLLLIIKSETKLSGLNSEYLSIAGMNLPKPFISKRDESIDCKHIVIWL